MRKMQQCSGSPHPEDYYTVVITGAEITDEIVFAVRNILVTEEKNIGIFHKLLVVVIVNV